MAGIAKQRAAAERWSHHPPHPAASTRSTISERSSKSSSSSNQANYDAPLSRAPSHKGSAYSNAGYDGNRDPGAPGPLELRNPQTARPIVETKNVDLPVSGWSALRGYNAPAIPKRTAPSTLGQGLKIALNTFQVVSSPTKDVWQYDVIVGNGVEKRGLIKRIWESKAVQDVLGRGWIFDGNKLAWSLNNIDREQRLTVDLDAEQGRKPRLGAKENKHRIIIRRTNSVKFTVLETYMKNACDWDNAILEAINFYDHVLREHPSRKYTAIKRSFFARGQERFELGGPVEAFKGVYQSLRIVHAGGKLARLSINVDVANGTFWKALPLPTAALQLTGRRDPNDLVQAVRGGEKTRAGQEMKKMRKLHVMSRHRGNPTIDYFVIDRFIYQGARDYKFEKDGKQVSIYDYYARQYNVRLNFPDLPLVKVTKGKNTVLPMEVLLIEENQRYNYKCDERQTSNMIKFAVTPPPQRWSSIEHGLKMLDWDKDPVLQAFGIKVNSSKTVVEGRLITAPKVQFGMGEAKPGTSGRWDLKGKKFLTPNSVPLKSWGVCVVPGRRGGKPDRTVVEVFIREFCKIYTGHGGKIGNKEPHFMLANGDDVGQWVTMCWNGAGNQANARPQLLVFILPDKDSTTYGRIKRSAECRYGVVSQCMQYAHVTKCQAQYISNVCMKVNAKLGGSTGRAIGAKSGGSSGLFKTPTLILGADVSHAAPGAQNASMAAITCSMDRLGIRYAAATETNGFRVEMITTDNINSMVKPLIQSWVQQVGGGSMPKMIIYFRDGVSEGQYQHVLQQEVNDMKNLLKTAGANIDIPFVVVVGSKRHHVRFFPEPSKADRNGNPLPGTLVETGVTHPFENDFYLCSHAAIKGTARPMHYHVIMNETGMSNEDLQTLIYEHCYQFVRATTPVSQHPAIYYAHIASNRAGPHDPKWGGSSDGAPSVASRPRSGSQGSGGRSGGRSGGSSSGAPVDIEKLLPMPNQGGIISSMWYI